VTKDIVRQNILKLRETLSSEKVSKLSQKIQDRVFKANFWPKSGRVGLYAPVRNEVMTQSIFQKALESGLHVYFPRVEQGIQFYEVNGPEDLQKGSWSILEPKKDCVALSPTEKLDLLIVPGIAFTKMGHRIGYGRGFYDKYISDLAQNIPVVGIAYDFQVIENFPLDDWDQPLTGVMTEKSFYTRE